MKLYRAVTNYFCCGLLVDSKEIIIEAAPIIKWAEGKSIYQFINWIWKKGGKVSEVKNTNK